MCFLFLVPIIPEFLYDINHPDAPLDSRLKSTTTTTPKPICPGSRQQTDFLQYDNFTSEFPSKFLDINKLLLIDLFDSFF